MVRRASVFQPVSNPLRWETAWKFSKESTAAVLPPFSRLFREACYIVASIAAD